jgi:WhiB family transcriptional regulator, redox-sensing transcriptional regulator
MSWRDQAACRSVDGEIFFPIGETGTAVRLQIMQAKTLCRSCPVLDKCREWAIDDLPDGIAGGLTADERRDIRRNRRNRRNRAQQRNRAWVAP